MLFHWKSLRRQIRLRGLIAFVSDDEADAYFKSRARDSRIGAWASQQSRPLESRFALEKAIAGYAAKFGLGEFRAPALLAGISPDADSHRILAGPDRSGRTTGYCLHARESPDGMASRAASSVEAEGCGKGPEL